MDTLPMEILVMICKHLSAADIARCCAVSRRWRDIFNNDLLWKPYCCSSMEETLRTTPCVVEPHFIYPEVEAANLSPIAKWRLAYMRERHLWDNWQQGNYKIASILEDDVWHIVFISNEFLLRVHTHVFGLFNITYIPSIELFNTIIYPPVLLEETSNDQRGWFNHAQLLNDKVIIVYEEYCIVYNLDLSSEEKTLDKKYQIKAPSCEDAQSKVTTPRFAITSAAIFGFNPVKYRCSKTLHVWDIETGAELKVENSFPDDKDFGFTDIITSDTTDNAVVVISNDYNCETFVLCAHSCPWEDIVITYNFRIYNGKELRYLSFVEELKMEHRIRYKCKIHQDFIAIAVNGILNIYSYQSHKLLTRCTITVKTFENGLKTTSLEVIDDCFAFIGDQCFKLYHPNSRTFVASIDIQAAEFTVISDALVCFENDTLKQIWKIGRHNEHKCFENNIPMGKVNRASTRVLKVKYVNETTDKDFMGMSLKDTFNCPSVSEWYYYW